MKRLSDDSAPAAGDAEAPDVPGFRTWGRVYLFVLGWFVALVILLTVFTRWFA